MEPFARCSVIVFCTCVFTILSQQNLRRSIYRNLLIKSHFRRVLQLDPSRLTVWGELDFRTMLGSLRGDYYCWLLSKLLILWSSIIHIRSYTQKLSQFKKRYVLKLQVGLSTRGREAKSSSRAGRGNKVVPKLYHAPFIDFQKCIPSTQSWMHQY